MYTEYSAYDKEGSLNQCRKAGLFNKFKKRLISTSKKTQAKCQINDFLKAILKNRIQDLYILGKIGTELGNQYKTEH